MNDNGLLNKSKLVLMGGMSGEGKSHYKDACKVRILQRTVNVLVFDRGSFQEVLKNREGDKDIESCKEVEFEIVKVSELPNDEMQIMKEYHGKNIWLKI